MEPLFSFGSIEALLTRGFPISAHTNAVKPDKIITVFYYLSWLIQSKALARGTLVPRIDQQISPITNMPNHIPHSQYTLYIPPIIMKVPGIGWGTSWYQYVNGYSSTFYCARSSVHLNRNVLLNLYILYFTTGRAHDKSLSAISVCKKVFYDAH